jgi:glycosyltransferase involved in cell wall biosynthesis
MPNPSLSLIIPAFNNAGYLEKLIQTINHPGVEIIVVDDGSADGDAIAKVVDGYSQARLIRQQNQGQYAAMNTGLREARGEVFCFINQDDLLPPGAIQTALQFLSQHPQCDAITGRIAYVDENGHPLANRHPLWSLPLSTYPYTSNIYHGALYIRRAVLEEHRLYFDPALKYAGDYDWILRLQKSGLRIGRLDKVLLNFRIHPAQVSRLNFQASRTEILSVAKKHNIFMPLLSLIRKVFFLSGLFQALLTFNARVVIEYLTPRMSHSSDE